MCNSSATRCFRLSAFVVIFGLIVSLDPDSAHALAGHRNYAYDRPGAAKTLTATFFGDSIVAGYCGLNCIQNSYAHFYTHLNSASASSAGNASIQGLIRGVSGNMSDQVLADMKQSDAELEASDIVTLEACGNDYLSARSAYKDTFGRDRCNGARLEAAVSDCKRSVSQMIDYMVSRSRPGTLIRVMNIYYPGLLKDAQGSCSGVNHADRFLQVIVEGNWYTCDYAWRKGVACIDSFADFNASDSNRSKIAWKAGESLKDYAFRLTVLNRDVITDPTKKASAGGKLTNLLINDNTHPNQVGHARLGALHHLAGYGR